MVTVNRNAIVVLPKEAFLQWLHAVDPTSGELSLADLREDPTIYLVAECADDEAVNQRVREVFAAIFEEQLRGWHTDRLVWPAKRTFDTFCQWFEWRFHSVLVDLSAEPLIGEDL